MQRSKTDHNLNRVFIVLTMTSLSDKPDFLTPQMMISECIVSRSPLTINGCCYNLSPLTLP